MFMNIWKGMESRNAYASGQCPDQPIGKLVSFIVDVPDEYILGKEDHALGPVSQFEEVKL